MNELINQTYTFAQLSGAVLVALSIGFCLGAYAAYKVDEYNKRKLLDQFTDAENPIIRRQAE